MAPYSQNPETLSCLHGTKRTDCIGDSGPECTHADFNYLPRLSYGAHYLYITIRIDIQQMNHK